MSLYCASSASSSCSDGAIEHKLTVSKIHRTIMSALNNQIKAYLYTAEMSAQSINTLVKFLQMAVDCQSTVVIGGRFSVAVARSG